MLLSSIKNTFKNTVRSVSFWLIVLIFALIAFYNVGSLSYSQYDLELKEYIYDTDPRFSLDYQGYIKQFCTVFDMLMPYAVPLLAIVSTALIVFRDYGDNFFEIEKASGIKPIRYLAGRLGTLIVINVLITTVVAMIMLHAIVLPRNGYTGSNYWIESSLRILQNVFARAFPCICFYVTFVYALSTIVRNGFLSSALCLGCMIACYAADLLSVSNTGIFLEYLTPTGSNKVIYYLYYYDTEWFDWMLETFNSSWTEAFVCWSILMGTAGFFFILAYFRIRKRTV